MKSYMVLLSILFTMLINCHIPNSSLDIKRIVAPIGPYSTAVGVNNLLFISGQIGLNPETGKLLNNSIEIETKQVMENIKAILAENQMNFKDCVKCSIFLTDIKFYGKVNEIYSGYFPQKVYPARETVAVVALPAGANIEISCIAAKD